MQKTRHDIVDYLREHGAATVDELCSALGDLTSVTVRHHLDILQKEGLVDPPEPQRRAAPGRPKYVYELSRQADALYPNNLIPFTFFLLEELRFVMGPRQLEVLLDGIARRMAAEYKPDSDEVSFGQKLDHVVAHLNTQGYEAAWEPQQDSYSLVLHNCPYWTVAKAQPGLCLFEKRYLGHLLGISPQLESTRAGGASKCLARIPNSLIEYLL
ncbi:MAG: ArsR family transcriptional regulator [Anaerolineae bacterium]|nr:ArsR family transcriptional regulator [Anaerolineae bacterium]